MPGLGFVLEFLVCSQSVLINQFVPQPFTSVLASLA